MNAIIYAVIGIAGLALGAVLAWLHFRARTAALKERLDVQTTRYGELVQENKNLRTDLQTTREKEIKLEAEKESFRQHIGRQQENLEKMEKALIDKFENLSNKIFKESSDDFKKKSHESLGLLLNPLKERIDGFQKKIDDSFGEQAKEQRSLKDQIKNIVEVHDKYVYQV